MTSVFDSLAVTWALTAGLLLCGGYHCLQAVTSPQLPDRVNNILHGLMHVLMVAMVWNLAPATRLAQTVVLAGAALWFLTQSLARPEIKLLCASGQSRLRCIYHSLTMAGAAVMIAMMGHGTTAGHDLGPSGQMAGMPEHHTMVAAAPDATATTSDLLPSMAVPLTVVFTATALIFTVLVLRSLRRKPLFSHVPGPQHAVRAEHSIEALGATAMALMFATMTA